jgi:hypothetical protein
MRIPQRLQLIKLTILIGIFVSVILSFNLWAGQRWFPKSSLFIDFTGIPAPFDYINISVLIALVIFAFISASRTPTVLLILFSIYLCIDDQNLLQPWFFNYILILGVLLFYKQRVDEPNNYTMVFISLQVLVALIYVFSGLQKMNSHFIIHTYTWMISPLQHILNTRQMQLALHFGKIIPYIELAIGLGLLIKPTRYIILPMVIAMHLFILLLLGPFGNSYNQIVWPWNIIMIILNLLLFANVERERFFDIAILFKGLCFSLVITLMFIFPFFSFQNKYDSYLSSSLYSGNTDDCKLILSDNAYKKLPYYIQNFVTTNTDHNILFIKKWALTELNAPCVPEYRIFKSVQRYVIHITETSSQEVKMEFTERERLFNL